MHSFATIPITRLTSIHNDDMTYEFEVDCFELGCLHCDRPTIAGEAYCSQSCRMAEVDYTTNTTITTAEPSRIPLSESPKSTTGFYLPPAINFESYRRPSVQSPNFSSTSPKLSPSSSRSSLKSEISVQAQNELMYYTNAFDRSREWKRRMTQ